MNAKPLDMRIFETKHVEEGRVYKQATPKLDFVHFQPRTSDDILAADGMREPGEFLLRD